MLLWIIIIIIYGVIGYGFARNMKVTNKFLEYREEDRTSKGFYRTMGILWLPAMIYIGASTIWGDYKTRQESADLF